MASARVETCTRDFAALARLYESARPSRAVALINVTALATDRNNIGHVERGYPDEVEVV